MKNKYFKRNNYKQNDKYCGTLYQFYVKVVTSIYKTFIFLKNYILNRCAQILSSAIYCAQLLKSLETTASDK